MGLRATHRDRAPRVPANADVSADLRVTPEASDDAIADDEAAEAEEQAGRGSVPETGTLLAPKIGTRKDSPINEIIAGQKKVPVL